MKIAPQGWVILKCKKVGDFGVQNDNADVIPITGRSYRLQESANERASRKQKPKMDSSAQSEN